MAPYSQTDLSVQDLIEQARVLRAQAFARGIKKAIQAISPARRKAADVVQPDLFQQPALMQEDSYFLPLVNGVQSLIQSVIVGLRRSAMRRQLLALDDRMLRDIGIRRDDISALVAGAFSGNDRVPSSTRSAAELYYLVPAATQPTGRGNDRLAA
ncbi:DUF1127 domain-containing protein [Thalassospiraceae bacterium LMO-SO8]|nr:DUF1127 domain-containing protein [Thalassospiraceae bacterium LMO-SO8]